MIRYIICPDGIPSRYDADYHWIGAEQLIRLYRLDPRECLVYRKDRECQSIRSIRASHPDATWLGPRYSGFYDLPDAVYVPRYQDV